MTLLSDPQREFVDRNLHAVLATARRDGSPQASTVHFSRIGEALYVGAGRNSAKFLNAAREPRVVLVVNEGPAQLVIYGAAELVETDPERVDRYREHRIETARKGSELGVPPEGEAFREQLDAGAGRALLRITPERALGLDEE